ncbi:CRISPR-associated endonuclease Cas2 [Butyrivibrio fibrisolvens]|uniref:CRISPR-associated endonuclease Cas2 n=1 Tax=Butyrivibrio fibrisolvens TaxID=831 RepID=UPI0004890147|nr:CRISPR-associated endonuclease Cas2 [Butyrivibrio fibrisolvens]
MFILLTYDIDLSDGGKNLRKVAKICEQYGIRVQNSVFEMEIDSAELTSLKNSLENVLNLLTDSVRIYRIGKMETVKIDIIGKEKKIELSKDNAFFF